MYTLTRNRAVVYMNTCNADSLDYGKGTIWSTFKSRCALGHEIINEIKSSV